MNYKKYLMHCYINFDEVNEVNEGEWDWYKLIYGTSHNK